jgi:hypothetical protein
MHHPWESEANAMSIIDPEGLFGGDRLRRCSNAAQLHWPRLFLASDGFARLEINYARIIGRAYPTFNPIPPEAELQKWLQEYANNSLLFLYQVSGQLWGQWDTRKELLPRYKTAADRRSPTPPEPAFTEWQRRYREENKVFPKCFGDLSENLQHGVGVGVGGGKTICASGDARLDGIPSIDNPPFETTEPDARFPVDSAQRTKTTRELTTEQETWFCQWWAEYWLHKAKKAARQAFRKHVRTATLFQQVMAATRAQKPEMLARESSMRPHAATWLNGERWADENDSAPQQRVASGTVYTRWEAPTTEVV